MFMKGKTLLLLIVCIFLPLMLLAREIEPEKMMFRTLSTADGLSSNNISAIYRDTKGYLWVGTLSGLNQSDAYHIKTYYHSPMGLPGNTIMNIFEDFAGRIWTYCENAGYAFYDYETGSFNNDVKSLIGHYGFQPEMSSYIGCSDDTRFFWGSDKKKIGVYDHVEKSIKQFTLPQGFQVSQIYIKNNLLYALCNNSGRVHIIDLVTAITHTLPSPEGYENAIEKHFPRIFIDNKQGLWLHTFTNSLLFYMPPDSDSWQEVALPFHYDQFNRVSSLKEDSNGNIWIVTSHNGAFVYEPSTKQISHLENDPLSHHTLASNNLTSLFIDEDNTVWIGNSKQGLSYYVPGAQTILNYLPGNQNDILSFYEKNNCLYIGTDGAGLLQQEEFGGDVIPVETEANVIVCIQEDSHNRLWIGTFQSGLICIEEGRRKQYTSKNSDLLSDNVYGIEEDEQGNIWMAFLEGIIQKLDPSTGQMSTIYNDVNVNIRDLINNGDGRLFAATSKGLLVIDTNTEQWHYATHNSQSNNILLPQTCIYALYKDSKQTLWLGTSDGLTCWNMQNDSVGHLTTTDGLAINLISSITEDHNGQIWVGSYNGISCIDQSHTPCRITNYDTSDGLETNEINQRAICTLSNGNIIFGTSKGLAVIIPKQETPISYDSYVYLTRMKYTMDNPMHNTEQCLPFNKKEISLEPNQLPASLYFSTFDFAAPNSITYLYRFNRLHDWQPMSGNGINFTTLPPGIYHMEVTVSNAQGQLSPKIEHLTLHILPPWYRTTTAYAIYLLVIMIVTGLLLLFSYRHYQRKERMKYILRETKQQQKLMDMKLTFFANVSHELRTPLSLIINPLEEYIKRFPQLPNSLLSTAHLNAKYLLELIDQLLSFRKIDVHGETMDYSHIDVVHIAQDFFLIYQQVAEKHQIHYEFNAQPSVIKMDVDNQKLTKIIHNLLSNAFRFTPDGGTIRLDLRQKERELVLKVSDTGPGISDENKEAIFEMFFQVKDCNSGGTGIGLYLVKQYVQMHRGHVVASDNHPNGTIITVTLPIKAQISIPSSSSNEMAGQQSLVPSHTPYGAYSLLVVDDNLEFLDFLCESLSTNYKVYRTLNGREGIQILHKEEIDLVVCDVMMPQMDGMQFCEIVKNDLNTSHIPIILLTAKAGEEFQLEGLCRGADDYITKPFHMEILKMRINKFIENSIKSHQTFYQQVRIEPSKITITPLDTLFIEKAIKIVEDNLSNTDFSVEELAAHLNISRGYLYRKLLKITGKTSIGFIRIIRMKRAQQLLSESQMQVAEVAYQLGYATPRTFTKHFKQEFGITPSQYLYSIKNDK